MTYRLKSNNYRILWPIYILKYSLPIFFISFFGQTFLLIVSLFNCHDGKRYYNSKLSCKDDALFYSLAPFAIIGLIIQILLSFITVSMYYQQDYINKNINGVLTKRNTFSDIVFLICKIITILTFNFDDEVSSHHLGTILIISIISGFNAYCNYFTQDYSNIIIKRFNNFLSLSLFISFCTLLIEKIFQSLEFSGGIYLFIIVIILIILYIYYETKEYTDFLTINFNNLDRSSKCLDYIKQYLKMVEEKDESYDSLMIFNSYIEQVEEKCTNKRCVLKKYLDSLSKGIYSKFLLLQYAEKLFKSAIVKFPKDVGLRLNYVTFLFTKVNKRKEAKNELILINPILFSLSDNFNLYIGKKYLEQFPISSLQDDDRLEILNTIQSLEYKNNFNKFKILISKTSSLYYDFWSSLYSSHIQGIEDLTKLNEIGNQINKLIKNIDKIFSKLTEIKNNDFELIKIYESFVKNILNDKEKYKKYHNLLMNLLVDKSINIKDIDYSNFNIGYLNESQESKYLIVSINEDNKGVISNISSKACPVLGYHKNEIIGKNINLLIPGLFQKIHDKMFNDLIEKTKTEFYDCLLNKLIYKPKFTELYVHGKNKSKYLVPLYVKFYLVQTEDSELVYILEIIKNTLAELKSNLNINDDENACIILTDNNFIINTFTPNCINLLKLNPIIINSNIEILPFLKISNEDDIHQNNTLTNKNLKGFEVSEITKNPKTYIGVTNNGSSRNNLVDNNAIESKLTNKKKLLKTKYHYPNQVTWVIENDNKASILYNKNRKSSISDESIYEKLNNINNNKFEGNFSMQVKEACISTKQVGYYFYFEKIKFKEELTKKKTLKLNYKKKESSFKHFNAKEDFSFKNNNQEEEETNNKNSIFRKISLHMPSDKKANNVNFDFDNLVLKQFKIRNDQNDIGMNINQKYIPECNFNFILNLNSMTYKPSNIVKLPLDLYEILKNQAIKKISNLQESLKKKKNQSESSISNSSSINYSSNSSIYPSDSNSSSDIEKKNSMSNIDKKETNITNKNKRRTLLGSNLFGKPNKRNSNNSNSNLYDDYYKVNIKDIKFIVYDYNKDFFYEKLDEKMSQVEFIINDYMVNQKIYPNEDEKYPNININIYNLNSSSKENKNNKNDRNKEKKKEEMDNLEKLNESKIKYEKEKESEKEIKDALSQKDEQKSINNLYLSMIIAGILFLVINIFCMLYVIYTFLAFRNNINIIIDSINLKYYNNFNIYYLRELSLINANFDIKNVNYTNFPEKDHEHYKVRVKEITKHGFSLSHSNLENILSSELSFNKNTTNILDEISYVIETKFGNSEIKKTIAPLAVSIIHAYASFVNLLSSNDFSIFNNEFYNYIHNGMNNLGEVFNILIELFIEELKIRQRGVLLNIIFNIIMSTVLYLIIYFIINKNYYVIVNKKTSYLSVFYGIGLSLIISSIKKSEIFINKMNQEFELGNSGNFNEESNMSNSFSSKKKYNLYLKENEIKSNKNMPQESNKSKKKLKGEIDAKSKNFQILFIFVLSISYLCLTVIIIFYMLFIKRFIYIGDYMYHMQHYHNNILSLYNAYREFLFNENSTIYGIPAYEYLVKHENKIYITNNEDINYLTVNNKYIQNLYNNYLELNEKGFCSINLTYYFESKEECEEFMGGKDGIISLSFHILVNDFVEEIRMARNYIKVLLNKKMIVGNLSNKTQLKIIENEYLDLINNKTVIFRMDLFNMNKTHFKLNLIFINIIQQYIYEERNLTFISITSSISNGHVIYIVLITIHILIIMLSVFFFWIPKIKYMNIEIYKAKNILSIIPIQILASLPDIKILLNLSSKNNKYLKQL